MQVYIYCTLAKPYLIKYFFNGDNGDGWNYETSYCKEEFRYSEPTILNGKVIACFDLKTVDKFECKEKYSELLDDILNKSCLKPDEFYQYGGNNTLYAWHIDDLKIFDKPESLMCMWFGGKDNRLVSEAPQSWRYVNNGKEKCILISIKSKWVEKILNGKKTIEIRKNYPIPLWIKKND